MKGRRHLSTIVAQVVSGNAFLHWRFFLAKPFVEQYNTTEDSIRVIYDAISCIRNKPMSCIFNPFTADNTPMCSC